MENHSVVPLVELESSMDCTDQWTPHQTTDPYVHAHGTTFGEQQHLPAPNHVGTSQHGASLNDSTTRYMWSATRSASTLPVETRWAADLQALETRLGALYVDDARLKKELPELGMSAGDSSNFRMTAGDDPLNGHPQQKYLKLPG